MLNVRFASALTIPAGIPNSNGLIAAFELDLVHHDPSFS
jgi:hypothetical protein